MAQDFEGFRVDHEKALTSTVESHTSALEKARSDHATAFSKLQAESQAESMRLGKLVEDAKAGLAAFERQVERNSRSARRKPPNSRSPSSKRSNLVDRTGEVLPSDVKDFVFHSFRLEPPPPAPLLRIVCSSLVWSSESNCMLLTCLSLIRGKSTHEFLWRETNAFYISSKQNRKISRIYEKLVEMIQNFDATNDEIDHALEAMEIIAPLSGGEIATNNYHLFHIVMQAPITNAYTQEKKWQAARFTMHGAYKSDEFLPWVGDPQDVLTFLGHHFELATQGGRNQDEPIQNALRTLAYASSAITIEALKDFDPTEPAFVRGICHVFQDDRLPQLRRAALFFLPLIGDKWFNTRTPIMDLDQLRLLCADWASAVDGIELTYNAQKATLTVLLGMINSPHWRPHIIPNKWKLLEYFTSVPVSHSRDTITLF